MQGNVDYTDAVAAGACENCGGIDYWVDIERGQYTCVECGCVDRDRPVLLHAPRYAELKDSDGTRRAFAPVEEARSHGAYREDIHTTLALARGNMRTSAPYRRETYCSERLSQWQMQEPPIPASDMRDIQREFDTLADRWGNPPQGEWPARWDARARSVVLERPMSKDMCRIMLKRIDTRIGLHGHAPYFVKKYLVSHRFNFLRFLHFSAWSRSYAACVSSLVLNKHGGV